ncbi:MAG: FAD-dependent oxidoreductase [Anaerolineae bacterium]|nr:FAD-dependent oxidoreductase [Anaerolineae bacterium]
MNNRTRYLILGAGIAGLTSGLELIKRDADVVIIEKNNYVGGLAQTVIREGFRFDLGGHRFHSNNPEVVGWLKNLLGEELITVNRSSRIYIGGKFVDYPLQIPGALGIFPMVEAFQMGVSYLRSVLAVNKGEDRSFEDWVVRRFGTKVYDAFFRTYTEKVWGIPCNELSADWAAMRIGIPNLWETFKHSILPYKDPPATAISKFYYPINGFGSIPNRIAEEFISGGGKIFTNTRLDRFVPRADEFVVSVKTGAGENLEFSVDHVISTIPLPVLLEAFPLELGSRNILKNNPLDYRSLICVLITARKAQFSPDNWTYFPEKESIFGRTHEPKNWSLQMTPDSKVTSLCAEIFTGPNEPTWFKSDDWLTQKTIQRLNEIGWLEKEELINNWVIRIPHAYPIYDLGYRDKVERIRDFLQQWKNLHLLGRTGAFKYMNSDGVIEDVFKFISKLDGENVDHINQPSVSLGRWV